ncbi:geranylgeranyl reductase family protein [Streptomyces roseoverticillatus]|uniref:geranylgeranyl reductase family protein n=1 Tax=Streptomyces roseoverticillatus TaxID=66429 RepID=UPI001F182C7E|nr:geranylgeranyl reductase family protein [Streptomyces roseoverticillatus]MCF3104918.1 geranylgeranyl reductase family protein [Streptomyces roseoverticillatus]
MDADVIVVGAGPAGATTAYWLARHGRRVLLLDRQEFPRPKTCGDALGPPAVRLLQEMGVLHRLRNEHGDMRHIRGTRVRMHQRWRTFTHEGGRSGLLVPRIILDEAIREQAVAAGAEMLPCTRAVRLLRDKGTVVGVEALRAGRRTRLQAPVVVVACGAAVDALIPTPSARAAAGRGQAVRGHLSGLTGLTDMLEIHTPVTPTSECGFSPAYGWLFPTGSSTANAGVGVLGPCPGGHLTTLWDTFLRTLRDTDPRFTGLRQDSSPQSAPMRFDFVPERCAAPGLLLVGDAAGMTSPFTGQGIGPAMESGRLAALAIHAGLRPGSPSAPDLSHYVRSLKNSYVGYFEDGNRSARRHLLVWRTLHSTFDSERPLFTLGRQALLFPDSFDEAQVTHVLGDATGLLADKSPRLRADLLAVSEVLLNAVRTDWPFLGRVTAMGRSVPAIPLRPALFALLAGRLIIPGHTPDTAILAAASVELGYLAALAGLSVVEETRDRDPEHGDSPANWGNMLALMVGDFLLSKANELATRAGTAVSQMFGQSLATATEGQIRHVRHAHDLHLTKAEHIAILAQQTATLFALPCKLGALLAGATTAEAAALEAYGRHLGLAFQLTEEARSATGQQTRLGTTLASDLASGIFGIPVLHVLHNNSKLSTRLKTLIVRCPDTNQDARPVIRLIAEGHGDTAALTLASQHAEKARAALRHFAPGSERHAMERLLDHTLRPPLS